MNDNSDCPDGALTPRFEVIEGGRAGNPKRAEVASGSTSDSVKLAYFSMEIAVDPALPTYSGGLGILAGDMLRSAADRGLPMAGVTLLHRKGYFRQRLDAQGNQTEEAEHWLPEDYMQPVEALAAVTIAGRTVRVRAWRYDIHGISGKVVPVYLLDTNVPENAAEDQALTDHLYGGDMQYRLCQEVVLGIGGVKILRSLGHDCIDSYHMNEGHSALLALALLEQEMRKREADELDEEAIEAVRKKCVFTTHTPVPAGHDQFPTDTVCKILPANRVRLLERAICMNGQGLNMTYLALRFSHYVNGVAMRHGEVSRGMFPQHPIHAITNGVHATTWTSEPFQALFDARIPEWRCDNLYLRYAIGIPHEEIRAAHAVARLKLFEQIRSAHGVELDPQKFTIGFARRASTYKRADLLFTNLERLKWIARNIGPLQVVYGGKAHPRDEGGKAMIRRVFDAAARLKEYVTVVYIEDYDMHWGKAMVSGVDLWLNTPQRPEEASGTSGMKAALNGVPSLSVLDGWWIEGHVEGVTGWAIGDSGDSREDAVAEASMLYSKLEALILPMFYGRPAAFAHVMRSAIAINGSFFNTQRVMSQYEFNAYRLGAQSDTGQRRDCAA